MRIYVGTYHKYNNGSIKGEWVDLDDYSCAEDFYEHCAEIHSDEKDPEYDFQDFDFYEDWEETLWSSVGESVSSYYDALKTIPSHLKEDSPLLDVLIKRDFTEDYSVYDSWDTITDEFVLMCCNYDKNAFEKLRYYIDWDDVERDLDLEGDYETLSDGRVVQFY